MRILIFSQYFTPEVTAARVRLHAFAEGLAARGHEVEVICEVPNHPSGVIEPDFRSGLTHRRTIDGFSVTYVRVLASPNKTMRTRLALYGSYAAAASVAGALARRPDVVLASSPPLPVGAAAALVAARHRVPWVFDVRDLWPEAAVALGELKGERAIRLAASLERRLYASASAIVTVTEPFREQIAGKGAPGPVVVLPNGTTRDWLDAGEAEPDRAAAGLPADRFVWLYAGNLGIAQGLETAVEAAGILGDEYQLVLLGAGPEAERLRIAADPLPPGQVEFRAPVQPADAARTMLAADALLVSLADRPGLSKYVPSKVFDCCALGRQVVLAASGESPRLLAEAGTGWVVPPGDASALAATVADVRRSGRHRSRDEGARAFAARNLREAQIDGLESLLASVSRPRRVRSKSRP